MMEKNPSHKLISSMTSWKKVSVYISGGVLDAQSRPCSVKKPWSNRGLTRLHPRCKQTVTLNSFNYMKQTNENLQEG